MMTLTKLVFPEFCSPMIVISSSVEKNKDLIQDRIDLMIEGISKEDG